MSDHPLSLQGEHGRRIERMLSIIGEYEAREPIAEYASMLVTPGWGATRSGRRSANRSWCNTSPALRSRKSVCGSRLIAKRCGASRKMRECR